MSQSATWLPQPVETAGFGVRTVAYPVDGILLSFCGGAFPFLVVNYSGGPAVNAGQQAAFDSRHQGWHDKIARTLVVRT